MGGDEALEAIIANLRKFSQDAQEQVAKAAAPLVQAAVRATAAAGTDPYGKPWAPKKDGSPALVNAPSAIEAFAVGPVIQIKVTSGYAIQNNLQGDSRRQVIPSGDKPLPKAIVDALREGARQAFARIFP